MRVVVPAYLISELKASFQVGMVLFLPFMVIDLVVASITTSMGMMQLPPVVISTPLKILLFVMVDGWNVVVGSSPARFHLRCLLELFLPKLAVLSPAEIPTTIEIQSMGVVS
jgi:flagellar biosynthesis protein FliP